MTPQENTAMPAKDRVTIRDLARRVAEIGNLPIQKDRAAMWRSHNDLERVRPMVLIFPEGAWREMLTSSDLTCESGAARGYEYSFRTRLYYWEHLQDDNVIEPLVTSPIVTRQTGWGIDAHTTRPAEDTGAYHIDPVILDESDIDKIRAPEATVDWEATARKHDFVQELLGDILTVEQRGQGNAGTSPLDHYATLRGIDNMFLDLVDNPAMVHRAVSKLVDGQISLLKSIEAQGALSLGNRNHYVGSGGTGYTSELPQAGFDGKHVRLKDLWGFATAQIFSEVSPEMHEEFALRYEKRFLDLFGLNAYGCCEPLHLKLNLVKTIPRLRRVSISPWADIRKSAEELGNRYVYSWKPNPAVVAADTWNPDAVRREIRNFLEVTRGCVVEMIMKDTHTCRNDPRRMWEWVRIAKEEAEAFS